MLPTLLAATALMLASSASGLEAPVPQADQQPIAAPALVPTKAWNYAAERDETTGHLVTYASVRSRNAVLLAFPQAEPNHGRLVVRHRAKYGFDVYVHIDKGQFLCNNYQGCNISIQFDETRPELFSGTLAFDNRPDVIFIQNVGRFLKSARNARRIIVSIPSIAGDQVLEFVVDQSLRWPLAPDTEGIATATRDEMPSL